MSEYFTHAMKKQTHKAICDCGEPPLATIFARRPRRMRRTIAAPPLPIADCGLRSRLRQQLEIGDFKRTAREYAPDTSAGTGRPTFHCGMWSAEFGIEGNQAIEKL